MRGWRVEEMKLKDMFLIVYGGYFVESMRGILFVSTRYEKGVINGALRGDDLCALLGDFTRGKAPRMMAI